MHSTRCTFLLFAVQNYILKTKRFSTPPNPPPPLPIMPLHHIHHLNHFLSLSSFPTAACWVSLPCFSFLLLHMAWTYLARHSKWLYCIYCIILYLTMTKWIWYQREDPLISFVLLVQMFWSWDTYYLPIFTLLSIVCLIDQ